MLRNKAGLLRKKNIINILFCCTPILISNLFVGCTTAPITSLSTTNTHIPSITEDELIQSISTTMPSSSATFTKLPTSTIIHTSTNTPTPTLSLPFLPGTPIPKESLVIEVSNVEKLQEIAQWKEDLSGDYWNLSLSPKGNFLAAASPYNRLAAEIIYSSSTITIWDMNTGEQIKTLEIENEKGANKVVFSPNGEIMAAYSQNAIQLWQVSDWTTLLTLRTKGIRDIAFSPDGKNLAYSLDFKVRIVDLETEKIVEMDLGEFNGLTAGALEFYSDREVLVGGIGNDILLWDPRDGKLLNAIKEQGGLIYLLKFSPDGDNLLVASSTRAISQWYSVASRLSNMRLNAISLWRHEDNSQIWNKELYVISFAYSPDGKIIAITDKDNIQLLRAPDGEILQTLTGHNGLVQFLAFTPDSKYLISASKDGTIRLWGIP
ncbi:MAG: hypothetical protein WBF08_08490 [Candidatus Bathyarchaeia archaeon]